MYYQKKDEELEAKAGIIQLQEKDTHALTEAIEANQEHTKKWQKREEEAQIASTKCLKDENDATAKLDASGAAINAYKEKNRNINDKLLEVKKKIRNWIGKSRN